MPDGPGVSPLTGSRQHEPNDAQGIYIADWRDCIHTRAQGLGRRLMLLRQPTNLKGKEYYMALTKDQLIADIAEAVDAPKAVAKNALEQLGQIVADQLENGSEITLPGIGKLKVTERPARTGRNPSTGAAIEIAAKKVVKFVPAKVLTDAINK